MEITTTRFGMVPCCEQDELFFPSGLFGFEHDPHWCLLADASHGSLFWLQNRGRADVSLAVADPREFVEDYRLCVSRFQLLPLRLDPDSPAVVLAVLSCHTHETCMNLRNPIVINPENRLGRQVAARDDRPLQYVLPDSSATLQKAA